MLFLRLKIVSWGTMIRELERLLNLRLWMKARKTSTATKETPLDVRRSSLRIVDKGKKRIDVSQRDTSGCSEVESENWRGSWARWRQEEHRRQPERHRWMFGGRVWKLKRILSQILWMEAARASTVTRETSLDVQGSSLRLWTMAWGALTATRETQLDDLSAAKEATLDAWTQDGTAFK